MTTQILARRSSPVWKWAQPGRCTSASRLTVARRAVWMDAGTWAGRKDRLVPLAPCGDAETA